MEKIGKSEIKEKTPVKQINNQKKVQRSPASTGFKFFKM